MKHSLKAKLDVWTTFFKRLYSKQESLRIQKSMHWNHVTPLLKLNWINHKKLENGILNCQNNAVFNLITTRWFISILLDIDTWLVFLSTKRRNSDIFICQKHNSIKSYYAVIVISVEVIGEKVMAGLDQQVQISWMHNTRDSI